MPCYIFSYGTLTKLNLLFESHMFVSKVISHSKHPDFIKLYSIYLSLFLSLSPSLYPQLDILCKNIQTIYVNLFTCFRFAHIHWGVTNEQELIYYYNNIYY